jgi:DNA-binding NarL/FixJ family response regulator
MIRLLIADDHAIVRRGLAQIVSAEREMTVAGEAGDAPALLEQLRKQPFDLLILDISMPGRSGLDVLKEIRQQYPNLPVLVLSVHAEVQIAVRALRSGAAGYITKDSVPDDLVTAIRKVLAGGKFVSASLAERLAMALVDESEKPLEETLSAREYEVMRFIASGKTVSEIAGLLSLSVKTVATYRTRILTKMRMSTNAELMHHAIRRGLVDD